MYFVTVTSTDRRHLPVLTLAVFGDDDDAALSFCKEAIVPLFWIGYNSFTMYCKGEDVDVWVAHFTPPACALLANGC